MRIRGLPIKCAYYRPTFIFLKGETKVDEVKGANKAYVFLSSPFRTANV